MIVIKSRHPTRKSGSGLFGNLFKAITIKVTKDGMKKVINKAVNSTYYS